MRRRLHRLVLCTFASLVATIAAPRAARADEAVCRDSYEQSQMLMKPQGTESTLLKAREALRTCMRSGCKDWIVADCSRWLAEVEARVPTVVFSARSSAGRDLLDVRVTTASGEPIAPRLDGRAVEVEPGAQSFVFVAASGARIQKDVLVREGEKAQGVAATFEAPPAEQAKERTAAASEPGPRRPVSTSSSLRYVGYGLGAAGILGLGVGTVAGLQALSRKGEANCDASNACDGETLRDAHSAADVATAGFIAGAVLLAGGVALVLLAPRSVRADARASLGGVRITW
jgi:hypothetical protein